MSKKTPACETALCQPDQLSRLNNKTPNKRPLTQSDTELSAFAKALGHPARIQILRLLVNRKNCICGEIVDELDLAQSTVSQHLKILKNVGLIQGEISGPKTCYCINPETLRHFRVLIAGL